ncbi:hypothetical protein P3T39_006811 [Kitasatospora sp. GP82]|nr:hypothetical protein [Kitasatospora sp. GP82]
MNETLFAKIHVAAEQVIYRSCDNARPERIRVRDYLGGKQAWVGTPTPAMTRAGCGRSTSTTARSPPRGGTPWKTARTGRSMRRPLAGGPRPASGTPRSMP